MVDKESYLLELCRYIVLNPVRAGTVEHPGEYVWSGYRATAGLAKKADFLSTDWILARFGEDRKKAQKTYRKFIAAGIDEESPWTKLTGRCLLGEKSFLEKLLPMLQKKAAFKEIPRIQRFALRPSLDQIFPRSQTRSQRNRAITEAHVRHG